MADQPDNVPRRILPIPDRPHVGLTTYDAKHPDTKYPSIRELRPPKGAPNVLIILLGDVVFGASSAFGGPCQTPNFEKLAAKGLKYNRFNTTALCSPTHQALLTGRNHHSAGMGSITEMATSAPGQCSFMSNTISPIARTLKLNGYSTSQFGKCHVTLYVDGKKVGEGRVDQTEPMVFYADETCDVGFQAGSPSSTDYGPRGNRFSGEVNWVEIDLGKDTVRLDHLISPEQRLSLAMAIQ